MVYESVLDPSMPEGRLHPADERHVAGAFRDNRVVPCEGIAAGELDERQQALLHAIAEDFLLIQDTQRMLTMAEFDAHLDETCDHLFDLGLGRPLFHHYNHGSCRLQN